MMQGRLAAWLVRPTPPPLAAGIAVGVALIVVETLLVFPLRQVAPRDASALVYLPGVLLVAAVWGLGLGVATSLGSVLAFDYFHVPPKGHFTAENWLGWLDIAEFLFVAVLGSSLAQLARARALEVVERRRETETIAELIRLILGADDLPAVLPEASGRIASAMQLPYAAIELGEVPQYEGRIQLPLRPGALVVPADLPDRVMRRLQDGVAPALATLLRTDRSLQALAMQQAALRRVAVLVANGVVPDEIVAAVATETAKLFRADGTWVMRDETPGTVTVVAEYGKPGRTPVLGKRLGVGGGVTELVLRESRPARKDSYDQSHGPLADLSRTAGFRASAGAPIIVDGRVWGVLVVLWARPGPPPGIEHELGQFTDLVATAIANTESRAELTASRARLVFAADEARRGIERDLHDGVQQRMISLGLELRAAEALVPPELGELRSRLSDTAAGLSGAFEDIQQIARGIHPAILSQGGLGSAIKALARRCPVPVVVRAGPKRRLPGSIEVAAYYVVSEALANSARHAHASAIDVDLDIVPNGPAQSEILSMTVHDDGSGGANLRLGSGLAGVRDRVEALGGTLTLSSPPGRGTSLTVKLPLDGQYQPGAEAGWSFSGT